MGANMNCKRLFISDTNRAARFAWAIWFAGTFFLIHTGPANSQPDPKEIFYDLGPWDDPCHVDAETEAEWEWQEDNCKPRVVRAEWIKEDHRSLSFAGFYASANVDIVARHSTINEFNLLGDQTNSFPLNQSAFGAGAAVGYNYRYPGTRILVGAFASFDYLPQTINQNFAGGTFIGTKTDWRGTVGAKAGYLFKRDLMLYTLAGVSFLNEDLNIYLGGPVTSTNMTVPGFTVGLGADYMPQSLQHFGVPVSVFVQGEYTTWKAAHLDTPAASSNSNYDFNLHEYKLEAGFSLHFR
jgi:opacity protein-like surface antigen